MKVKEYIVVNDKEFHPHLKVKHTYNWDWNSITTLSDYIHILIDCFHIDKLSEEYAYVIAYNGASKLLGIFNVAHGNHERVYIGKREVFIFLLLVGAEKFILVHNHPCGLLNISAADKELTEDFESLGDEIEIEMEDHVIVSANGYHFILRDEQHLFNDIEDPECFWLLNKMSEEETDTKKN